MADAVVGLAEAIAALRKELLAAIGEGADAAMRFKVAPVELSMQVAVTKNADGKIGWHVLGWAPPTPRNDADADAAAGSRVAKADGSWTSEFMIADQGTESPRVGPRTP